MTKELIYESEELLVQTTGQDYDFIATMENKAEGFDVLVVVFTDDYEWIEPVKINPSDWIGIEANEEGYETINAIQNGKFYTIFEEDYGEENS